MPVTFVNCGFFAIGKGFTNLSAWHKFTGDFLVYSLCRDDPRIDTDSLVAAIVWEHCSRDLIGEKLCYGHEEDRTCSLELME